MDDFQLDMCVVAHTQRFLPSWIIFCLAVDLYRFGDWNEATLLWFGTVQAGIET